MEYNANSGVSPFKNETESKTDRGNEPERNIQREHFHRWHRLKKKFWLRDPGAASKTIAAAAAAPDAAYVMSSGNGEMSSTK